MRRPSRKSSATAVRIPEIGVSGLDYESSAHDVNKLAEANSVRVVDARLARRKGGRIVDAITDDTAADGSWSFPLDADYALIPAADHLNLPAGGFARRLSFRIGTVPVTGTGMVLATRANGVAYGPHTVYIDDLGDLYSQFRTQAGVLVQNALGAVTPGEEIHLLDIYDPTAGTWSSYVDGALIDEQTGLASNLNPYVTADQWALGSEYNPATGSETANTSFDGDIDAVTIFTLAGIDIQAARPNGRSLADTLIRWSLQTWPNPQSAMVRAQYACDESVGTTLIDSSRYKNHATLVGSPTSEAGVAYRATCGHYVGVVHKPDGTRFNTLGADGRIFREQVR